MEFKFLRLEDRTQRAVLRSTEGMLVLSLALLSAAVFVAYRLLLSFELITPGMLAWACFVAVAVGMVSIFWRQARRGVVLTPDAAVCRGFWSVY